MGAPITALATAAMPHIAMPGPALKIPTLANTRPRIAPADAPTSKAGENTPPNIPKPIQSAVRPILATSNIIKLIFNVSPLRISETTVVPRPRASGTHIPTMPAPTAALMSNRAGDQPDEAANRAL